MPARWTKKTQIRRKTPFGSIPIALGDIRQEYGYLFTGLSVKAYFTVDETRSEKGSDSASGRYLCYRYN
jgi:hypothetical protein